MKYLLDTNVLGELRSKHGDVGVKHWIAGQRSTDLAISVITVIEIELEVRRRTRSDPRAGALLDQWLRERVLTAFIGRILPLDLDAARYVAPIHLPDAAPDHAALIAATALAHDLAVVTRNERDFHRASVRLVNPWSN